MNELLSLFLLSLFYLSLSLSSTLSFSLSLSLSLSPSLSLPLSLHSIPILASIFKKADVATATETAKCLTFLCQHREMRDLAKEVCL